MEVKEKKTTTTMGYKPQNRKIRIEPILRRGGAMPDVSDNVNHDGRFMYSGTKLRSQAAQDLMGRIVITFEEGEQEYLEQALGFDKGYLNPNKPKDTNYWCLPRTIVTLDKNGISLNLSNPQDHIKWKIIESMIAVGIVSPSYDQRLDKPYKFMVVDADIEIRKNATKADLNKEAWMAFGAISTSIPKMRNLLRIYNNNSKQIVPKDATENFLKGEISKIIETNPEKFIDIANDPDFSLRAAIVTAIEQKLIIREGYKYYFDKEPDDKFVMDELIKFLKDPANTEKLLKLKKLIEE